MENGGISSIYMAILMNDER